MKILEIEGTVSVKGAIEDASSSTRGPAREQVVWTGSFLTKGAGEAEKGWLVRTVFIGSIECPNYLASGPGELGKWVETQILRTA